MNTNETIKWQEEQALQRYQLIAPLLDESLDNPDAGGGRRTERTVPENPLPL